MVIGFSGTMGKECFTRGGGGDGGWKAMNSLKTTAGSVIKVNVPLYFKVPFSLKLIVRT